MVSSPWSRSPLDQPRGEANKFHKCATSPLTFRRRVRENSKFAIRNSQWTWSVVLWSVVPGPVVRWISHAARQISFVSALRPPLHFVVLKLTDADGENAETATWLDFARDCGYLAPTDYARLADLCREVGSMLGAMLFDPAPFLLRLS